MLPLGVDVGKPNGYSVDMTIHDSMLMLTSILVTENPYTECT